jgi:trehalose 6-phosphate phosphatase
MWLNGRREDAIDANDFRHRLSEAKTAIEPLLKEKGVFLEDKGSSATIHYRLSHNPKEVEDRLLTVLESLGGLRFMRGKLSTNIMPPLKINKGSIVLDIIERFGLKSAIYLGDDVTDIDAFRALSEFGKKAGFKGFSVAVMGKEAPPQLAQEADYTLDGIEGVEAFLSWLRGQVSPAR